MTCVRLLWPARHRLTRMRIQVELAYGPNGPKPNEATSASAKRLQEKGLQEKRLQENEKRLQEKQREETAKEPVSFSLQRARERVSFCKRTSLFLQQRGCMRKLTYPVVRQLLLAAMRLHEKADVSCGGGSARDLCNRVRVSDFYPHSAEIGSPSVRECSAPNHLFVSRELQPSEFS